MNEEYKDQIYRIKGNNSKNIGENEDDNNISCAYLVKLIEKCRNNSKIEDWEEMYEFLNTQDYLQFTEDASELLCEVVSPIFQTDNFRIIELSILSLKDMVNSLRHPRSILSKYSIIFQIVNLLNPDKPTIFIPILNIIEQYIDDENQPTNIEIEQLSSTFRIFLQISFGDDPQMEIYSSPLFDLLYKFLKCYQFSQDEANEAYSFFSLTIRTMKDNDFNLASKIKAFSKFLSKETGYYTNFCTDGTSDKIFNFILSNDIRCVKYAMKCMLPLFSSEEIVEKYIGLGLLEKIFEILQVPSITSLVCYDVIAKSAQASQKAAEIIINNRFLSRPQLYNTSKYKEKVKIIDIIYSLVSRGYYLTTEKELKYIPRFIEGCMDDDNVNVLTTIINIVKELSSHNEKFSVDISEDLNRILDEDFPEELQELASLTGDQLYGEQK